MRFRIAILGALVLGLSALAVPSESEYRLKAAFLVQFVKFVEWPQSAFDRASSPLVIGILGSDPFGKAIDDIASGERAGGREIVVRRLRWGQDVRGCQILFIPREETSRAGSLRIDSTPILVVGEQADFAKKIGSVNFYIDQRKVRFEINPDRARACGLTVSSRLLALARVVKGGGG